MRSGLLVLMLSLLIAMSARGQEAAPHFLFVAGGGAIAGASILTLDLNRRHTSSSVTAPRSRLRSFPPRTGAGPT